MTYRIASRLAVVAVLGLLLQAVLPHLPHRLGLVVGSVPVAAAGCYAVAGLLRLARGTSGRLRAGWAVGAASSGLLATAYLIYTCDALLGRAPSTPNVPDLLSLAAAGVAMVAVLLVSPPLSDAVARLTLTLDVATVAGALYALAWQFVLADAQAQLTPGASLMFLVVTALELLGAALALVLMARTAPTRNGYALRLLAGGLGTFAATAVVAVHNRTEALPWYATGAAAGYLTAASLIALASRTALPSADDTGQRVFSGVWPLLPYVPAALAVVEIVHVYVRTTTLPPVLVWLLLSTVTIAMFRQLLMLITIRRLVRGLHHQAHHDTLTGLPNRAAFYAAAAGELASAPADRYTAVLLVDLDGFKLVNDTLGHAAGDALLVTVGRRLQAALRDSDTAARLGGDEFVALLPELAAPEQADEVARRLLDRIQQPMSIAGREMRIRASIGIALGRNGGPGLEQLLHHADTALYQAKDAGKATFRRHGLPAGAEPGRTTAA